MSTMHPQASVTTAVDKDNNTAGSGTLFTLTQTMSKDEGQKQSEFYNVTGKVPQYATRYYYKSWWHKLFRKDLPIRLLSAM